MSPVARVAAFVALLAAIFAGAALAGGAIDPSGPAGEPHAAADAHAGEADAHGGEHATAGGGGASASEAPAGVSSSHDGLRIVPGETRFAAGRSATLRFRIVDAGGATVRDFDAEQARLMHVIVVRRDLRRYQHLHPAQGPDGAWSTPLRLPDAGVYRAFADFSTSGERHTLGVDLFVPGDFAPLALPAPAERATSGDYEVRLHEHAGEFGFFVRRDGRLVTDLEPHLGARGHLVALREGDLAYRHVHPLGGPPPEVAFEAGASEPGRYRLFFQFRHRDRVRTVAFTHVVRQP